METLDIHAIRATLPHRYPMLLVDRVLELEPGVRIRALKNVTINEPFFPGHFPSAPVMPGVLIIEALAQACALLAYRSDPTSAGKLFLFAGIDEARFKRQVVPGDALVLESTFDKGMRDVSKYSVRATVDGRLACEAKLMAILRPAPSAG